MPWFLIARAVKKRKAKKKREQKMDDGDATMQEQQRGPVKSIVHHGTIFAKGLVGSGTTVAATSTKPPPPSGQ